MNNYSPMHNTLFEVEYQKTCREQWKTLPNSKFYSQRDAEYIADALRKVVLNAAVRNTETDEIVYTA